MMTDLPIVEPDPRAQIDLLTECYANLKVTALGTLHQHCHADGKSTDDRLIYDDLQSCLDAVKTSGVIFRHADGCNAQICLSFDLLEYEEEIRRELAVRPQPGGSGAQSWSFVIDGKKFCAVSVFIPPEDIRDDGNSDEIVLLEPSAEIFGDLNDCESNIRWFSIAATFREIFIQRNRAYHHFPTVLSSLYWDSLSMERASAFVPPWGKSVAVPTITLSLDLRKSTLAMEQARDHQQFARWMHDLLKRLTDVALNHWAVFDKFTGDGVIVHFLVDDLKRLPGQAPDIQVIERAVCCAATMIREVEDMLPQLRKTLLNDCDQFGAGVGLAVDEARWSTDHAGNPIVVGRGVVAACRAADRARAGIIRLVNSAYQDYQGSPLGGQAPARRQIFESKEFAKGEGMRVWDLHMSKVRCAGRFAAISLSARS